MGRGGRRDWVLSDMLHTMGCLYSPLCRHSCGRMRRCSVQTPYCRLPMKVKVFCPYDSNLTPAVPWYYV